jgi:hypothetical protein
MDSSEEMGGESLLPVVCQFPIQAFIRSHATQDWPAFTLTILSIERPTGGPGIHL